MSYKENKTVKKAWIQVIDRSLNTTALRHKLPTTSRSTFYILYAYLDIIKGVVLPGSVRYVTLSTRPPKSSAGFWLVSAASSWKTWPLPNVWHVEDIVFAVQSEASSAVQSGLSHMTLQCLVYYIKAWPEVDLNGTRLLCSFCSMCKVVNKTLPMRTGRPHVHALLLLL